MYVFDSHASFEHLTRTVWPIKTGAIHLHHKMLIEDFRAKSIGNSELFQAIYAISAQQRYWRDKM